MMNGKSMEAPKPDLEQVARENRDRLLRSAAQNFTRHGYEATKIDMIAESVSATKGLFYYHFKSKAEIYFQIQFEALAILSESAECAMKGDGNALERLREMARGHVRILLTDFDMQKVALQGVERHILTYHSRKNKLDVNAIIDARDAYEQMFAETIDAAASENLLPNVSGRIATKPFFGCLNWSTVWYHPSRVSTKADLDRLVEYISDFAMQGLKSELGSTIHPPLRP